MPESIVLIGAGSAVFTRGLVAGLIGQAQPVTLALVDTDPAALAVAEALTRRMVAAAGAPIAIRASLDRRAVLPAATAVICTIGVGGRRAWEQDVFIPRRHGLYAPVGDTVGPGGTSRALRMVPAMVAIARDVLDLAPEALFFNYSNPMAPICRAVRKLTGAPIVGLCHGVAHVAAYLAETLEVPVEDLTYSAVGLNHLTWFVKVKVRGVDALPRLRAIAKEKVALGVDPDQTLPGYPFSAMDWPHHNLFSWELLLRFGAFPSAMDRHTTEFFPQVFRSGAYYGQRLGIDAFSFETTIAEGDAGFEVMRRLGDEQALLPEDALLEYDGEKEEALDLIRAIREGRPMRVHANLPNVGQVPNLPLEAILESPAVAEAGGVRPLPVAPLSPGLVGTLATRVQWVEAVVAAALSGDRDHVVQALVLDGSVDSLDMAARLSDELLSAQADYLPQFERS